MYLSSHDVVVNLIYDWLDVVLHHQYYSDIVQRAYQNISTELVGFVLNSGILLGDDSPNIASGFPNALSHQL